MRRAFAPLLTAVAILIADPAIVSLPPALVSHSIPIEAPLAALAIAAPGRRYLRKQQVADRYQTTTRNIELKVAAGVLPPPEYFGRFPIWDEALLDEYDRRRAAIIRPKKAIAT
jgi:hypothetical protein